METKQGAIERHNKAIERFEKMRKKRLKKKGRKK